MRIRVAAVSEPRPPWLREIEILFASLDLIERDLQRIAYFVGEPPAETRQRLARLGVDVRVTAPVHAGIPQANKLRMLEEPDRYDVLFALDTDVLATGDFTRHANDSVRAKPADSDPIQDWPEIFAAAGVAFPTERVTTTTDVKETLPYFQQRCPRGPVAIRRAAARSVAEATRDADGLAVVARHPWTRDQIALSIALLGIGASCDPDELRPEVAHHHHRVSRFREVLRPGTESRTRPSGRRTPS